MEGLQAEPIASHCFRGCCRPLALILCGIIYISYNRPDLPDSDAFIRFEPPTKGHIYDANGHVLIALGRERREIIQYYKDVPDVLRQAILSAEDENFFSHAGVDFSVFPRMLGKTNVHALFAHVGGTGGENAAEHAQVFPQGGSTITEQLVRGYFLQKLKSTKTSNTLQHQGLCAHVLAFDRCAGREQIVAESGGNASLVVD